MQSQLTAYEAMIHLPGKCHGMADTLGVQELPVFISFSHHVCEQTLKLGHNGLQQLPHQRMLFLKEEQKYCCQLIFLYIQFSEIFTGNIVISLTYQCDSSMVKELTMVP